MIIDPNDEKHLIADEGKVLARVTNLRDTYIELWLGYHTNSDGTQQMDTYADFTEIIPNNE